MLIKSIYNRTWAILIARLILGLIFFIAGVWKVFTLGSLEHARRMFVELIAGGLLIAGLLTRTALLSLGAVLVLVTVSYTHLRAHET